MHMGHGAFRSGGTLRYPRGGTMSKWRLFTGRMEPSRELRSQFSRPLLEQLEVGCMGLVRNYPTAARDGGPREVSLAWQGCGRQGAMKCSSFGGRKFFALLEFLYLQLLVVGVTIWGTGSCGRVGSCASGSGKEARQGGAAGRAGTMSKRGWLTGRRELSGEVRSQSSRSLLEQLEAGCMGLARNYPVALLKHTLRRQ